MQRRLKTLHQIKRRTATASKTCLGGKQRRLINRCVGLVSVLGSIIQCLLAEKRYSVENASGGKQGQMTWGICLLSALRGSSSIAMPATTYRGREGVSCWSMQESVACSAVLGAFCGLGRCAAAIRHIYLATHQPKRWHTSFLRRRLTIAVLEIRPV